MKPFTESLRYEYDLTPSSIVIDAGCHEGNWSMEIWKRYGCRIFAFEPMMPFYWNCLRNLSPVGVAVLPYGLGDCPRITEFLVHGSMSGMFGNELDESVEVEIISLHEFLSQMKIDMVDLIKLNVEGMEFEILEHIIAGGLQASFRNIQVQFHSNAPKAEERWHEIRFALEKTHEITFHEVWCWTNFKLK